jgi:hypothetical protein
MRPEVLRFSHPDDEGVCGLYTIANALSILYPRDMSELKGALLVTRLASALPTDFNTIMREGTDRGQMEVMLPAAMEWAAENGMPFAVEPSHPASDQKAQALWDELARAMARRRGTATLVVGFGDDDAPNSRYEPHWTCVETIGPRSLTLRDSTCYRRVLRAETGIRPEHGWEIEDAFLLHRPA